MPENNCIFYRVTTPHALVQAYHWKLDNFIKDKIFVARLTFINIKIKTFISI